MRKLIISLFILVTVNFFVISEDQNSLDDVNEIIRLCIEVGNLKTVKEEVINNSIDLNIPDQNNNLPLTYAYRTKNLEAVKLLVDLGASNDMVRPSGEPIITDAFIKGNLHILEYLVSINTNLMFYSPLEGSTINFALDTNDEEIIVFILNQDVELNLPTEWSTPLIDSISKNSNYITKKIIEHGADINQEHLFGNYNYGSPLTALVYKQDIELLKYFIDKGLELKPLSTTGWTALMTAALINNIEIGQFLIDKGININSKTIDGKTAKNIAEENNNLEFINFIDSL